LPTEVFSDLQAVRKDLELVARYLNCSSNSSEMIRVIGTLMGRVREYDELLRRLGNHNLDDLIRSRTRVDVLQREIEILRRAKAPVVVTPKVDDRLSQSEERNR
jgi:hypothetical protein